MAKPRGGGKHAKHSEAPSEEAEKYPIWWIILVVIGVLVATVANNHHIWTLFENDRHFSHLADFEREMAYRTEMGLYFSYYKTIITAPSFSDGLYQITHDNVTEYGHMINTLKRFNLYPEVYLSATYRIFKHLADLFYWRVETCWRVNRGEGMAPVEGCEGIGNSHYFYINHAFGIAGTVAGSIFILGVLVSDSLLGGIISVAAFFFNHGEATRVQWTPPLRETFGFPFIIGQIVLVTYVLKNQASGMKFILAMTFLGSSAMLSWQFTQFAFFTQVSSLFVIYALDFVPLRTMKTLMLGHLLTFVISYVLLFGNEMLLTAMYFPSIIGLMMNLLLEPIFNKISFRPLYLILSSALFGGSTIALKFGIATVLQVEDDAHIMDLLRSKFTNYANFHTRLYTCSAEFDFMPWEMVTKLSYSALIPSAAAGVLLFTIYFIRKEWSKIVWRSKARGKEHSEVIYNIVQLACYTVMAVLIMRLKLFYTPHLCVVAAVVVNSKLLDQASGKTLKWFTNIVIAGIVVAAMANEGLKNIQKQLSIHGEYSNPEQEFLFDWIKKNTEPNDVFCGTMPVMANVKLSTLRPIINHPHYEDVGIRNRTLQVYSMFSKKPLEEVHQTLKSMGANYFVFQLFNCAPEPKRPHCAYRGMWDEQDPENKDRVSLCDLYQQAAVNKDNSIIDPFKIVYNPRNNYIVIKI